MGGRGPGGHAGYLRLGPGGTRLPRAFGAGERRHHRAARDHRPGRTHPGPARERGRGVVAWLHAPGARGRDRRAGHGRPRTEAEAPPSWLFQSIYPGFPGETLPGQTSLALVDLSPGRYLVLGDTVQQFEVVGDVATPGATPAAQEPWSPGRCGSSSTTSSSLIRWRRGGSSGRSRTPGAAARVAPRPLASARHRRAGHGAAGEPVGGGHPDRRRTILRRLRTGRRHRLALPGADRLDRGRSDAGNVCRALLRLRPRDRHAARGHGHGRRLHRGEGTATPVP